MSERLRVWLSLLRAEAQEPGFICRVMTGLSGRPLALMAGEVLEQQTDAELWAHVVKRYKEG